ncbi:nitroreductase family deazaflavin-dependent oxidoreductase [Nocardia otitidiscaviarum]|uniref:Nitroreductase family deazaflavin-dependent oxidoreductase n=1 Tax=Nocardia otitidiscaviarum TaxID=1823 RepID=A0A516NH02_9NOCA|nr:nitroreductase/quinone reductase family protein [Nocardia otitidiscaviarum]MCP9619533.1 nitroreductase family deazaflavin-dependent oxidoreductase [Nocardia otitidiscaviarum]QDP78188.1 nitroreductase family deazaflavin-dependent oxidoreductase [Nocardia otitidiscaviarum]
MSYEESRRVQREAVAEFRANGGKLGGVYAEFDVLLLTTEGDGGERRTVPVGYARDGERLVVFAADNGRERGPNWFHDLVARPRVEVEVGREVWSMVASVAAGEERKRLWDRQIERWGFLRDMQDAVEWEIPIVVLTR